MVHTCSVTVQPTSQSSGQLRRILAPVLVMAVAMGCWNCWTSSFAVAWTTSESRVEREGLWGYRWRPFLHSGFSHLIANTVPFIVLGLLVAWRSDGWIWPVTITIAIIGGLESGSRPANTVTIGASGLVFGFPGYLLTLGILTRRWLDILIAVVVLLVYGGLLWGAPLLQAGGVSWLAHLTGAAAGALAAFVFRPVATRRPRRESCLTATSGLRRIGECRCFPQRRY